MSPLVLIGIKVTDLERNRINLKVAIARLTGKQISFLLFLLVILWCLLTPKNKVCMISYLAALLLRSIIYQTLRQIVSRTLSQYGVVEAKLL